MNGFANVSVRGGLLLLIAFTAGCIERKLTVTTEPSGAVVWLNDEEIGPSPVTVNFKWYGDYKVRVEKSGHEILATHRQLDAPAWDSFPLDFFATVWPGTFRDHTEWHFDLQPAVLPTSEQLMEQAQQFRSQVKDEMQEARREIQQSLLDD